MKENKKKVLCGDMIDCGKIGKKVKTSGTKGCLSFEKTEPIYCAPVKIDY